MLTGDFNSKVGRRTGPESCIGQWPRGRQNQNGTNLVKFCEKNDEFIASSSFQHPAKHITTWSQRRTNPKLWIYNQIHYIILNQKNKQVLTDACSYGRTETSSDHRLVIARIELTWAKIYHQKMPNTSQKGFTLDNLNKMKRTRKDIESKLNKKPRVAHK